MAPCTPASSGQQHYSPGIERRTLTRQNTSPSVRPRHGFLGLAADAASYAIATAASIDGTTARAKDVQQATPPAAARGLPSRLRGLQASAKCTTGHIPRQAQRGASIDILPSLEKGGHFIDRLRHVIYQLIPPPATTPS